MNLSRKRAKLSVLPVFHLREMDDRGRRQRECYSLDTPALGLYMQGEVMCAIALELVCTWKPGIADGGFE